MRAHPQYGLFWVMRSGKTRTTIRDIVSRGASGGIIVTPNRNKGNWVRQVPQHSDGQLTVLSPEGTIQERIEQIQKAKHDVYVLNVEALPYMADFLKSQPWPFFTIDESTAIKNHRALRTKVSSATRAPVRRILSGLPNPNSPMDLYSQFTFLSPTLLGGNYWRFQDHFAIMGGFNRKEVVGFKNLEELYRIIAPYHSQVGEDALDILPTLPPVDVDVPLEGKVLKHYLELRDELRTWWADGDELKARTAITQILRLSQVAGGLLQNGERTEWIPDNPKAQVLDDLLEEIIIGPKDKVIVVAIYRGEIGALRDRYLKKYSARAIYGEEKQKDTDRYWQEFQTPQDPTRVMIVQPHSGGQGLELHAARTVIYYTGDFSLEAYQQVKWRTQQIGNKKAVRVLHLMARLPNVKGRTQTSIDETRYRVLAKKMRTAGEFMRKAFTNAELREVVDEVLGE